MIRSKFLAPQYTIWYNTPKGVIGVKFQFEVKMTDQDYLDFNTFITIRSYYGKKQMLTFRLAVALIFFVVIFISLFGGGFSVNALIGVIPMVIVLLLVEIFFNSTLIFYTHFPK